MPAALSFSLVSVHTLALSRLTSTGVTIDKEIRSRTLQMVEDDADQSISESKVNILYKSSGPSNINQTL